MASGVSTWRWKFVIFVLFLTWVKSLGFWITTLTFFFLLSTAVPGPYFMSQLLLPIHSLECLLTAWSVSCAGRVTSGVGMEIAGRLACVTNLGQASSSGLAQHGWPWPCTLNPLPYQFCTYGDRNGDNDKWGEKQEREQKI